MGSQLDLLISRIEGRGLRWKKRGKWHRAEHPCSPEGDHEKMSFSFCEDFDGKVSVNSHKPAHDEKQCLDILGMSWGDLYPPKDPRDLGQWHGKQITRQYEYTSANGTPVGAVLRTEDKQFPQGHYENGEFKYGLNGKQLPIYRLPALRNAILSGRTIYITEGEKDADAWWMAGQPATTKPGGASSQWQEHHIEALRGATIAIIADNDVAGEMCAVATYTALRGACTIKGIFAAKEGKDSSDHLAAGLGTDDLIRRKELEPKRGLDITTFNGTFETIEQRFLVEPYFPCGKLVLVDADSGMGKSTWLLTVAAGLSRGFVPFGPTQDRPVKSLYLYMDEDLPEDYEDIYRENGGKEGYISYFRCRTPLNAELAQLIIETIEDGGFELVIFDPFTYFLGNVNSNADSEVRPGLALAGEICRKTGVTAAAVRHTGKDGKDKEAHTLGIGSYQFRASARGQLVMQWHPDTEQFRGVVVVSDLKGSIKVAKGEPFAFRKLGWRIEYVELTENPFTKTKLTREKEVIDWLMYHVPHERPVRSRAIEEVAIQAGFNLNGTFNRAKQKVCISTKQDGVWFLQRRPETIQEDEYNPYTDS